jgi:porin
MKKNLKTTLLMCSAPISLTCLLSLGVVQPALAQASGEAAPAATPA